MRLKITYYYHRIKQSELAVTLKTTQATLSNWERGVHDPDNNSLSILADKFNVSTDYILYRTSDPTSPNQKSPIYDDEAWKLMEEMHKRPELKTLFSTSTRVKKEDIEFVDQLLKRMAGDDYND